MTALIAFLILVLLLWKFGVLGTVLFWTVVPLLCFVGFNAIRELLEMGGEALMRHTKPGKYEGK